VIVQFEIRRGNAEEWLSVNPILGDGEPAYEEDTGRLKLGDGVTAYADRPYILGGSGGGGGGGPVDWSQILGKPATFPPDTHQHNSADVVNFVEAVQDAAAGLIQAGAGIEVLYNDASGILTIGATGGTGGATDPEVVRDTIGTALRASGLITVTINDSADTMTIGTTATQNSTDAQLRDRATHTGTQAISTIDQLAVQLASKQDAGWAGMPPNSGVWIQFNASTNTWPPAPTSRLDIHFEYQGGDLSHPPPGRSGTVTDDQWTLDVP
jgi:hypothetical protein